ncbi:Methyltransferase domain-containing protein [Colwellia chukchiensis]|uniref:Methyltransferase domain-containing protein n=1 Tax=Colwellia chukchiensis TaxID=641665 RepID=A0A1H7M915_9GAMM|nr:class I SAM-dependent methyltransferase [Colwellia chukchiensis]SEL07810.1 Methyltransferase domain-containing protein [Colwellia chukchiensis]
MKPALAFRQPHYPQSWLDIPNGELIVGNINQVLSPWWAKFFGYHLLKIGALSDAINSEESPIKHQLTLSNKLANADIIADIDDLPLLQHSIDVCVLSHALEFSLDPHHVLREANRVLIPNGYLVITGFNAMSLAGLNQFVPYRRKQAPWNERLFSPMRVKDWLHLMGYEIQLDQRFLHSSLVGKVSQGPFSRYWQHIAARFLPSFGSVYAVIAKKRQLPLTPIKAKWQLGPSFEPVKVPSMNSSRKNNHKIT